MGSMQRADRFEQLYKALKKHYKPVTPVSDRKVLDHLLYACCLQDATYEAADEAFAKLQQAYFDSNEIRVTTIAELSESLTSLPHAAAAANRIKKLLQGMFETRYSFDIDDLKKANLGKAVDEISGWVGVTKFMVSYVTQHAFGGHAIPVDESTLIVCHLMELLTQAEMEKGTLPGVERAIAKSKGIEFATLLHQFAVDHAASHKNALVVAVFKELGMTSKPKAPPPPPPPAKPATPAKSDAKAATKGTKPKSESPEPAVESTSKAKQATPASSSKTTDAKPSKSALTKSDETKSPGTAKKMTPPPAGAKPTGKSSEGPAKSSASATKKPTESSDKKPKAQPATKSKPAASGKPSTKKPIAKKVEANKPQTKKGAAASPKPVNKRPTSAAKSTPKKLPVKPVTKKRTKPR